MRKKYQATVVHNFEIYSHIVLQNMILIYQSSKQKVDSFSPYIIFPFSILLQEHERKVLQLYNKYITILACDFCLLVLTHDKVRFVKIAKFCIFFIQFFPVFISINHVRRGFVSVLNYLAFIHCSRTHASRIYLYILHIRFTNLSFRMLEKYR